jgi:hypothetical protein
MVSIVVEALVIRVVPDSCGVRCRVMQRRSRLVTRGIAVAAVALGFASCSSESESSAAGEFCDNVEVFGSLQDEGDRIFQGEADIPVEELRDVFARLSTAMSAMVDTAPDEVAADATRVARTTEALIDAFTKADFDVVAIATDPQFAELLVSLEDAAVIEAQDRLNVYFRTQCGVDLNSTTLP